MGTFDFILGLFGLMFAITAMRSLMDKETYSKKGVTSIFGLLLLCALCFGLKFQVAKYVEIPNTQYITLYYAKTQHEQPAFDQAIAFAMSDSRITALEFRTLQDRFPESFINLNKASSNINGSPMVVPLKMDGLQSASFNLLNLGSNLVSTMGIATGIILLLFAMITYVIKACATKHAGQIEIANTHNEQELADSFFSPKRLTITAVLFLICGFTAFMVGSNIALIDGDNSKHQLADFIQANKNIPFIQNLYAEISADGKVSAKEMNQLINVADNLNAKHIKSYLGQQD